MRFSNSTICGPNFLAELRKSWSYPPLLILGSKVRRAKTVRSSLLRAPSPDRDTFR
jgi:hypothetical protein